MKILYLAFVRLPTEKAHGMQIVKTCEAFADAGATVELVIPVRARQIPEEPFSYYGARRNFTLTELRVPDWIRFGPIGFALSALWFAEAARWLKSFRDADIIYSRDASVLAQYILLGRRLVYEAHQKPTWLARFVARRAERVVVISGALAEAYRAAGVPSGNVIVAPDAVDVEFFAHAQPAELGGTEGKTIILYTGHLYERKGVDTLAAATPSVPDAFFIFAGGNEDDVARFKERWGSAPNIRILGHRPPAEIPGLLAAADVLVLPNSALDEDSARFSSPMKLFEYMASGKPIIASDVPSVREVLSDQNVLFVQPDNAGALAKGIAATLAQPAEAAARAERARQDAAAHTWRARAGTILRDMA